MRLRYYFALLASLAFAPAALGQTQCAATSTATLKTCITTSGYDITITIQNDFEITEPIIINHSNGEIIIKSDGAAKTLTRGAGVSGDLFTIHEYSANITATFENVIIDGGNASGNDGSLIVMKARSGELHLTEGTVLQNNNTTGNGGGVQILAGDLYLMGGGEIKNNTAGGDGGGVYANGGFGYIAIHISGSRVSGNAAGGNGGGVAITSDSSYYECVTYVCDIDIDITGSEIVNNTAGGNGGGVFVDRVYEDSQYGIDTKFDVSGAVVIKDNEKQGGAASNVYLSDGKYISAWQAAGGTKIGITAENSSSVIINSNATKGMEEYFFADDPEKVAKFEGGQLKLIDDPVCAAGDEPEFAACLAKYPNVAAGDTLTVKVTADFSITSEKIIPATGTITAGAVLVIESEGAARTIARGFNQTDNTRGLLSPSGGSYVILENIILDGDKGNTAFATNKGSLVALGKTKSTLEIRDGAVLRNNAGQDGGGIYCRDNSNTLIMNGGEISGNTASSTGGGVFVSENCIFAMNGGAITGNTASSADGGGGVGVVYNGKLTIGGDAVISGNTKNGAADNVSLAVAGGQSPTLEIAPSFSGKISVSGAAGIVIMDNASAGDEQYFESDDPSKIVKFKNNQIVLADNPICAAGDFDEFEACLAKYPNFAAADTLTVRVTNNITLTAAKSITTTAANEGATLIITSEGTGAAKILTRGATGNLLTVGDYAKVVLENIHIYGDNASGNGALVYVNAATATLEMRDRAMLAGGNTTGNGGGVNVNAGAFNMLEGQISTNTAPNGGGGVSVGNGSSATVVATFNMSGGNISGNSASSGGGGVFVRRGGSFNMSGGTIDDNNSNGVNLQAGASTTNIGGRFTMTGGEISGNTTGGDGGGVMVNSNTEFTVGGTAVIFYNTKADGTTNDNVSLVSGKYITLAEGADAPAAGMEIWVSTATANGTIVQYKTKVPLADYVSYFKSDVDGKIASYGGADGIRLVNACNASNTAELQNCIAIYETLANSTGGDLSVNIMNDFNITSPLTVDKTAMTYSTLKINSDGAAKTLTRGAGVAGDLFTITGIAHIMLENIKIDGGGSAVSGSLFKFEDDGQMTMVNGAVLQNNHTTGNGGGVYMNGGYLEISYYASNRGSPEISNNIADGDGGGVYVAGGGIIMEECKISGNEAKGKGGGVAIAGGTFYLYCEIINNTAGIDGGGVMVYESSDEFVVHGATIIKDNHNKDGAKNNISLASGKSIMSEDEPPIEIWVHFTGNTGGAVMKDNDWADFSEWDDYQDIYNSHNWIERFHPDNSDQKITRAANGDVMLFAPTCYAGSEAELEACLGYYPLAEAGDTLTVKVTDNFSITATQTITTTTAGAVLVITSEGAGAPYAISRGFTGSSSGSGVTGNLFTLDGSAKMVLQDIVIDGNKDNYTASTGTVSLVLVNATAALEMRNGAVLQNNKTNYGGTTYSGGVYVDGAFVMNGGAISGNELNSGAPSYGGGVYVASNGTFAMNGGEISGNKSIGGAGYGGGVYVSGGGSFAMNGGTISGNEAKNYGSGVSNSGSAGNSYAFTVGGTAKIINNSKTSGAAENVYLASDQYITLASPAPGMKIGVTTANADGIIVEAGASAADTAYFVPDVEIKMVKYENNKILLVDNPICVAGNAAEFDACVTNFYNSNIDYTINIPDNTTISAYGGAYFVHDDDDRVCTVNGGKFELTPNSMFKVEQGELVLQNTVINGFVAIDGGRLTIIGGEISGNDVASVSVDVPYIVVGGNAKILGNPNENLVLGINTYIILATGDNAPRDGMEIWVSVANGHSGVIVQSGALPEHANYFHSDDPNKIVKYYPDNGGQLRLIDIPVCVAGSYGEFTTCLAKYPSLAATDTLTIKVTADFSITATQTIDNSAGATLVIASDGGAKTLTRDANLSLFVLTGSTKLVLENIVIDGNKSDYPLNTNSAYTLVAINIGATLEMNDGAVLKDAADRAVSINNGTFIMTGGEISGNRYGVLVSSGAFTIIGGEISGNNSGAIINDGTFTVGGTAKIHNNSSAYEIRNLAIVIGKYITLDTGANAPRDGMKIGVSSNTYSPRVIIDSANDGEEKYFFSDNENREIIFDNGQIKLVSKCKNPVSTATTEAELNECVYGYNYNGDNADYTITIPNGTTINLTNEYGQLFPAGENKGKLTIAGGGTIKALVPPMMYPIFSMVELYDWNNCDDNGECPFLDGLVLENVTLTGGRAGVDLEGGKLTMIGSEISGNEIGVYSYYGSGSVVVGGNAKVFGNSNGNVILGVESYIAISTEVPPIDGMEIWVSKVERQNGADVSVGGVIVQTGALPEHANYFHSDDPAKVVKYYPDNGGQLRLIDIPVCVAGSYGEFTTCLAKYPSLAATDTLTVKVTADFSITAAQTISATNAGATLIITSEGGAKTLTRGTTGYLFTLTGSSKMVLENIVIDGDSSNIANALGSLVYVNSVDAALEMNAGAILQNNSIAYNIIGATPSGGGVYVSSGAFNMSGGEIRNNTVTFYGGGVYVASGVFDMTGGKIIGNAIIGAVVDSDGSGVAVGDGSSASVAGTFNMSGTAEITDNSSQHTRWSVFVRKGSAFNMSGGLISNNLTGGVNLEKGTSSNIGGRFAMTGGEISGNVGKVYSVGVSVNANTEFTVGGSAKIFGNESQYSISNVNLDYEDAYIALSTTTPPSPDMRIGVAMGNYENKVIVNSGASDGQENYFFSDREGRIVIYENNQIKMENIPVCEAGSFEQLMKCVDRYNYFTAGETLEIQITENIDDLTLPLSCNGSGGVLVIKSKSDVKTLKRAKNAFTDWPTFPLDGAHLILENIIIDGNKEEYSGDFGFFAIGASDTDELEIRDGVVLKNSKSSDDYSNILVECGMFTMNGGEISGNEGGGVHVSNYGCSKLTLGGAAKIFGNTTQSGEPSNVYLENSTYITLATGDNAPRDGMEIWVTVESGHSDVIVNTGALPEHAAYFHSDDPNKAIKWYADNGGQLRLVNNPVCYASNAAELYDCNYRYADVPAGDTLTIKVTADISYTNLNIDASNFPVNPGAKLIITSGDGASKTITFSNAMGSNSIYMAYGDIEIDNIVMNAPVFMETGTFTMKSGKITGGNGALATEGGAFVMTGGEIIGNEIQYNEGSVYIYNYGGALTVGGTAVIKDNTYNGEPRNVYLDNGVYITLSTEVPPADGMEIWINGTATPSGVIVQTGALPEHANYFHSDDPNKAIKWYADNGGQLRLVNNPVCVAGTEAQFTNCLAKYPDFGAADTLTVKVTANISTNSKNTITTSTANAGSRLIITSEGVGAPFAITETINDQLFVIDARANVVLENIAIIAGGGGDNSTMLVKANGTLEIGEGAVLKGNKGSFLHVDGGTLNMTGGLITENIGTGQGGGVVMSSGAFNMTGGEISGNKMANGGGVYVNNGTFTVGGAAVIKGNTKTDGSADNVYLASGKYITLGAGADALADGAEVWVSTASADGVIVNAGANWESVKYFFSDDDNKIAELSSIGGYNKIKLTGVNACTASNTAELQNCLTTYSSLGSGDSLVVKVKANFDITSALTINNSTVSNRIPLSIKSFDGAAKTLTRGAGAVGDLFTFAGSATEVYLDNIIIDGGNISGNNGSLFRVDGGHLMTERVVLRNNYTTGNGGAVYVNEGDFATYGGVEFINNKAGGDGGGVYINSSSGNSSICIWESKISGNEANGKGGGIAFIGSAYEFSVPGTEITNNIAGEDGGGMMVDGDVNNNLDVQGAIIKDNTTKDGARNNVSVASGKYISSEDGAASEEVWVHRADKSSGVIMEDTYNWDNANWLKALKPDIEGQKIHITPDDKVVILAPTCLAGSFEELETCLGFYQLAEAGDTLTVKVTSSFDITAAQTITTANAGAVLVITSEGAAKTLTRGATASGDVFRVNGSAYLVLKDIIIDGNKANYTATGSGALVHFSGSASDNASLEINEGTVLRNNYSYGVFTMGNAGNFVMNGGKIIDNDSRGISNGHMPGTGGTISIKGGEISGNNGGAVTYNGSFNMTGGEISGNTYTSSGAGAYIYGGAYTATIGGSAKIFGNFNQAGEPSNVYLANGKYVALASPAPSMKIGIATGSADGVIVDAGAAAGQEEHFVPDVDGEVALFDGGAIKLVTIAYIASADFEMAAPVTDEAPEAPAITPSSDPGFDISYEWVGLAAAPAVYEQNKAYTVKATLQAQGGYLFDDGLASANAVLSADKKTLTITRAFPATDKKIASLELEIEQPFAGEEPAGAASKVTGAGFDVKSVAWSPAAIASGFEHDETYSVEFELEAQAGYTFPKNLLEINAKLNGIAPAIDTSASRKTLIVYYEFAPALSKIPLAEVVITAPATDSIPEYENDIELVGDHFIVASVKWNNATPEKFLPNTEYTATVVLTADDGYVFANGKKTLTIEQTFPKTAPEAEPTENEVTITLESHAFEKDESISTAHKTYLKADAKSFCADAGTVDKQVNINISDPDLELKIKNVAQEREEQPDGSVSHSIDFEYGKNAALDTLLYTLSKSGEIISKDTLIVITPLDYSKIIMQKWNVLIINNNPLTNGGYQFSEFEWFKNGEKLNHSRQYYGEPGNILLKSSDSYSAELSTPEGVKISTCPGNPEEAAAAAGEGKYQKRVLGVNGKESKTGGKIFDGKGKRSMGDAPGVYIVEEK